jgi:serine/threonine-protein kinase
MRVPHLRRGTTLTSPVSKKEYVVDELLAAGGFGAAYAARRGRRRVCLKITDDSASWHREAYMAELLHGHPRVIRVHEAFPVKRGGRMLYAIAMELACGAVADVIDGSPWRERRVVAQVRGLLTAVDHLHASGALHRDITPFNVYVVGDADMLKLGDFGIARHGPKKGVPANAFNPWFVDSKLFEGSRSRWTSTDDLWQVGQLVAVLLTGEVRAIQTREVKDLPCSDRLKLTVRRAIGEPAHRYPDAKAFAAGLRGSPLEFGRVRNLDGRTVSFSGPLGITHAEATKLARRAGARVIDSVSGALDVLVVGDDSPGWIAGSSGGVKILETMALRERGYPITMITARHFANVVGAR